MTGPQVHVDVDDRQHDHRFDARRLADLLANALQDRYVAVPVAETTGPSARKRAAAMAERAEVGLAFVDVAEMAALNGQHMGGDGPTDVLAFPIDGVAEAGAVPAGQPVLLGDIVICPAVAAKAPQDLDDELALLVVHGALHLLGHDHREPGETAEMKALERSLLDRYHRSDPQVAGSGP
jgi:probable rRNA maturation factor